MVASTPISINNWSCTHPDKGFIYVHVFQLDYNENEYHLQLQDLECYPEEIVVSHIRPSCSSKADIIFYLFLLSYWIKATNKLYICLFVL